MPRAGIYLPYNWPGHLHMWGSANHQLASHPLCVTEGNLSGTLTISTWAGRNVQSRFYLLSFVSQHFSYVNSCWLRAVLARAQRHGTASLSGDPFRRNRLLL